nr:DUF3325 domain-containing protein [Sphingomonas jejuensis]
MLATVGFGMLGLATDAHYRRRFGLLPAPERKRRMRAIGWILLALSLMPPVIGSGWIFGPVLACGTVMTGAGISFLLLNLLPAPPATGVRPAASSIRRRPW